MSLTDHKPGVDISSYVQTWMRIDAVWNRNGIGGTDQILRLFINGPRSPTPRRRGGPPMWAPRWTLQAATTAASLASLRWGSSRSTTSAQAVADGAVRVALSAFGGHLRPILRGSRGDKGRPRGPRGWGGEPLLVCVSGCRHGRRFPCHRRSLTTADARWYASLWKCPSLGGLVASQHQVSQSRGAFPRLSALHQHTFMKDPG